MRNFNPLFLTLILTLVFCVPNKYFGQKKEKVKKGTEKIDFEKYEKFMGPYFKDETPEEFRKRMKWFDDADMGMFIHFGLYSHLGGMWKGIEVPGNNAEWLWARVSGVDPDYHYQQYMDLVNVWNPKDFDAEEVVLLAKELGMEYITITTKHHEGFCLWPSKYTEFDIESTPMKGRDILKEISTACRKHGLKFGAYYSITDWHQAIKEGESRGKAKPTAGGGWAVMPQDHKKYFQYMKDQLKEIVDNYDADLIWFDADWAQVFVNPERSYKLYEYVRGLKPSIIINERCFSRRFPDLPKKDFGNFEHTVPSKELIEKQQDPAKRTYYEYCTSTQKSWGHDRRQIHPMNDKATTPQKMLGPYVLMKKMHGNYLLNFGPDETGKFNPQAVAAAKDFAKAARKLDEGGDYSKSAMDNVISEMNLDVSKYINENHLSNTNKNAHKRAVSTGSLSKKINTEMKKFTKNKDQSALQKLSSLIIPQAEKLILESQQNDDPEVVKNKMKNLQLVIDKAKEILKNN